MPGSWPRTSSRDKAKLVFECVPSESAWQHKTIKNNVAKVRLQGDVAEAKNVNVNKPSINALVDAFENNSNDG
jgi:hypothetical protein